VRNSDELLIAGSGTDLAPVARIAEIFEQSNPGQHVRVAQSIGTSGATRALADRAIDIGLASRPLTIEERASGIEEHPFARVALAPTVHEHVARAAIETTELARIYTGEVARWPDGTPVVPILRQPGDSAMRAIATSSPELEAAIRAARTNGRGLTRYTDQEVRDTLLAVPGAIGFLDAGTIALERLPLRPLELDGVPPTAAMVRSGRHPFVLTLSLLTRTDARARVRAFVELATSEEVAELLGAAGYAPVAQPSPGGD